MYTHCQKNWEPRPECKKQYIFNFCSIANKSPKFLPYQRCVPCCVQFFWRGVYDNNNKRGDILISFIKLQLRMFYTYKFVSKDLSLQRLRRQWSAKMQYKIIFKGPDKWQNTKEYWLWINITKINMAIEYFTELRFTRNKVENSGTIFPWITCLNRNKKRYLVTY